MCVDSLPRESLADGFKPKPYQQSSLILSSLTKPFDAFLYVDRIINLIMLTTILLSFMQLPIYFVVSLGCYGLLMVGVGLMNFPTCPQEALLLQKVFSTSVH